MYSTSTQKKYWTFSKQEEIDQLRNNARTRYIQRLIGSLQPPPAQDALLTAEEEHTFLAMVEENALRFCRSFQPPLPVEVIYTAFNLFKRFYLQTSVLNYLNVKNIMTTIIYLACKVENMYMPLNSYVSKLTTGKTDENMAIVRNLEPIIIGRLNSHLFVHEPFTPLEGLFLTSIVCSPGVVQIDKKIRHSALMFLGASMSTDASLLYSPSQIALAAFYSATKEVDQLESFHAVFDHFSADKEPEKKQILLNRIKEIYTMVKNRSTVPSEIRANIQQRLSQCSEFIRWAKNALHEQGKAEPELMTSVYHSSSEESIDMD